MRQPCSGPNLVTSESQYDVLALRDVLRTCDFWHNTICTRISENATAQNDDVVLTFPTDASTVRGSFLTD
jgi:hypothetical protein